LPLLLEAELAAIPKRATPGERSNRRAKMVDESSLERDERMKAARNLDFKGNKDHSQASFLLLSNDMVLNNLGAVGIYLGQDQSSIDSSISNIKQLELERVQCDPKVDKLESLFDLEEKEEIENEEVDKLILNSLCSEIMDEVMELASAHPKDCNTTLGSKTSSHSTTRGKKMKNQKGNKYV
jgi:hypothetical protein